MTPCTTWPHPTKYIISYCLCLCEKSDQTKWSCEKGTKLCWNNITGWAVAQTCCISQYAKYRKSGIFGYPWEQTPEPIAMKLGLRNYVLDSTTASKYGSDRAAWGVSAHAWNITVCDFLFFLFSFLQLAYARLTDFHDLYIKRRVFAQGSAFWGSRWWIFTFAPFFSPKFENLHYGLWQLQTAITRPFLKIEERCLHHSGGFRGRAI